MKHLFLRIHNETIETEEIFATLIKTGDVRKVLNQALNIAITQEIKYYLEYNSEHLINLFSQLYEVNIHNENMIVMLAEEWAENDELRFDMDDFCDVLRQSIDYYRSQIRQERSNATA